jgi:hypothetical protein
VTLEQYEALAHAAKVLGVEIEADHTDEGVLVCVNRPFWVSLYPVACGQVVGTAAAKAGI